MKRLESEMEGDDAPVNGQTFSQNVGKFGMLGRFPTTIGCVTLLFLWAWAGFPYQIGWFIPHNHGVRPATSEINGHYDRRPVDSALSEPWNQITPSDDLIFHDCFGKFQCARLDLPMDWNATKPSDPRVILAIVKLPARVAITDPRYGGMLWLQDGGPGESSVNLALESGDIIQMIIDSDLDPSDADYDASNLPQYFDILGVDLRGINNSVPHISCFPSAASRELWSMEKNAEGVLGSSDNAFSTFWAREQALGKGCSDQIANSEYPGDKLAFHANTSPTIGDMVAILELNGQWREKQVRRLIGSQIDETSLKIVERTRWRKGEERLFFWGFSYGTVVGATFAAMQPHRVHRLVIDGVEDTGDYYRGERLLNVQDADSLLYRLSELCEIAGPEKCSLHTGGGPQKIMQRFYDILEFLRNNPIGVPSTGLLAPDLITYSDVKRALKSAVYAPIQLFPSFVEHLVDLSNFNGTSFAATRRQISSLIIPTRKHCQIHPYTPECQVPTGSYGETRVGTLCTDGNSTSGISRQNFEAFRDTVAEQSRLIGDIWPEPRMSCIAWNVTPKWRFPGPFNAVTSQPILMVGTTLDPCTPLRNAFAMSNDYPGSSVLAVEGEGHTTLSVPSLCMARNIRAYFQRGTMPVSGAICDADEKVWLGRTGEPENAKDAKLLDKLSWMANHYS